MTEAIIVCLEIIGVDHKQPKGRELPGCTLPFNLNRVLEAAAIIQTCQFVRGRKTCKFGFDCRSTAEFAGCEQRKDDRRSSKKRHYNANVPSLSAPAQIDGIVRDAHSQDQWKHTDAPEAVEAMLSVAWRCSLEMSRICFGDLFEYFGGANVYAQRPSVARNSGNHATVKMNQRNGALGIERHVAEQILKITQPKCANDHTSESAVGMFKAAAYADCQVSVLGHIAMPNKETSIGILLMNAKKVLCRMIGGRSIGFSLN